MSVSLSSLSPLPNGSRIQVIEATSHRLAFVIPPGGRAAKGMLFFAVLWLGIVGAIAAVFVFVFTRENVKVRGDLPPFPIIAGVLSLFVGIGLVLLIAAIRMSYTRLMLAVERDRFVLQRELWGRQKIRRIELDEESHAELETAYTENDRPVYRVVMVGATQREGFGTGLSDEEIQWLCRSINQFLGKDLTSTRRRSELPSDTGDTDIGNLLEEAAPGWESVRFSCDALLPACHPRDLSPESPIRYDDSNPDQIEISYPLLPPNFRRVALIGVAMMDLLIAVGMGFFLLDALADFEDATFPVLVFAVSAFVLGLFPYLFLKLLRGLRVQFAVDRETLTVQVLMLRPIVRRTVSLPSVLAVGMGWQVVEENMPAPAGRKPLQFPVAVLWSRERTIPLTLARDEAMNRELGGVLRHAIEEQASTRLRG